MKIVCLDAATLGDVNLDEIFSKFGEFVSYDKTAPELTIERLKDADIVITNKVIIDKNVISHTKLKLICVSATGVNNIDLDAAASANIPVKNVAGYSTNSVVQQTFANLLALINQIKYYDDYAKSTNGWAKSDIFVHLGREFTELTGKTFCVVGLGAIGRGVAHVAKAFGCDVCYYSTSRNHDESEFRRISFDEALKCDIVSIHAPLNSHTKNLFDANSLAKLKRGAILANFGRGGIVDENEIAKLIDEDKIYFCADVLENEPMRNDHPFLRLKNTHRLILTPHVAWASVEARRRLIKIIEENIKNFVG